MKAAWRRYAAMFDALTLRERTWVYAAAVTVLLAAGYVFFIEVEMVRQKRLVSAVAQKQGEMRALEAQTLSLIAAQARDPDRDTKARLAELRAELARVESGIASEERRFTAPGQMRGVVEGLLGRNRAVTLVSLRTLPVSSVAEARAAAAGAPKPDGNAADRHIFRHGLELQVAGSYLDLLAYVRDLESLPNQLYWGGLEIDALAYPRVVMKLTVYTLSLDRAWLNV